jgi:hypothetical protein
VPTYVAETEAQARSEAGLIPHERVMSALQLLCEEVMPRFH